MWKSAYGSNKFTMVYEDNQIITTVILSIEPRLSASLTRSFDIFLLTLSKGTSPSPTPLALLSLTFRMTLWQKPTTSWLDKTSHKPSLPTTTNSSFSSSNSISSITTFELTKMEAQIDPQWPETRPNSE